MGLWDAESREKILISVSEKVTKFKKHDLRDFLPEWSSIEYKYDEELDVIYFIVSGNETESGQKPNSESVIYVAVPSVVSIKLTEISRIQSKLIPGNEKQVFVMALVDSDSTIIYYKMTKGFLDLDRLVPEGVLEDNNICK